MKNYEILEDDEDIRKRLQEHINNLDLEFILNIYHPAPENSCALEVNYKIKYGDSENDPWVGEVIEIYVNDNNPSIHIYDSPWVAFGNNSNGSLGIFRIEGMLFRLYSDDILSEP